MSLKITLYNEISLDGAYAGYPLNPELYYRVAQEIPVDAVLVGSTTARTSTLEVDPEEQQDYYPPLKASDTSLPYLVIPDSDGKLQGMLHMYRSLPYCRDVVIGISKSTPAAYRDYLAEREYPVIETGEEQVDLRRLLHCLSEKYGVQRLRADSGGSLNGLLLDEGLADELVLILAPVISGDSQFQLFDRVQRPFRLSLLSHRQLPGGYLLLRYRVEPQA